MNEVDKVLIAFNRNGPFVAFSLCNRLVLADSNQ